LSARELAAVLVIVVPFCRPRRKIGAWMAPEAAPIWTEAWEGTGVITNLPIVHEIVVVFCLLVTLVLTLVWCARQTSQHPPTAAAAKGPYAAVILSESQQQLVDTLVLPKTCVREVSKQDFEEACASSAKSTAKGRLRKSSKHKESLKAKLVKATSDSQCSVWGVAKLPAKGLHKFSLSGVQERYLLFDADQYRDDCHATVRTPLLVFVNRKSGGQRGDLLIDQFQGFLPEYQVWEIGKNGGPEEGLRFFAKVPNYRVLVAGGDGTAAWVLETIDALDLSYHPPLAVLPVGTGNDLARVLGWGGGLSGGGYAGNGLARQLLDTAQGQIHTLDRWAVHCSSGGLSRDKGKGKGKGKGTTPWEKSLVLNNYFGIGVDAQISLNFHKKREASPHLFTSRFINKVWYASSGGKEILLQRFSAFSERVVLECDGELVKLPPGTEGVIVLNIGSYGGGVNLWGTSETEVDEEDYESGLELESVQAAKGSFLPASYGDGLLEVVSVASSFQLGAAQVGLARPARICQCRRVRIVSRDMELPVQVDGEPFTLPATSSIDISFLNQGVVLTKLENRRDEVSEAERIFREALREAQATSLITAEQTVALASLASSKLQEARRARRDSASNSVGTPRALF